MSSFYSWHSGHSTRPRVPATQTSAGVEVGVNRPAQKIATRDCTTDNMVHIRRSNCPMAWNKCTCGRGGGTIGVPSWSGVNRCRAVVRLTRYKKTKFVVMLSFLAKTKLHGSHNPLEQNKRGVSLLVVHTENLTSCDPLRRHRNRPEPAMGSLTSFHQGPLLPLLLCNFSCAGALQ